MLRKSINGKQVGKNIILSIMAQAISLLVSIVINLIVPKAINEYQYAYWQTYVLYVGYVGVLHFGLLDGIMLRYSQYNYEELDKRKMRSQFCALLMIVTFFSLLIFSLSTLSKNEIYRIVFGAVAIGVISKNLVTYTSYTFQMTNRINNYVSTVITQRAVFGIFSVVLLISGVKNFYWFCAADLIGDCAAVFLGTFRNKGMYFGKMIGFKEAVSESWRNIFFGILLLVANWASMFIVDGAKMVVQWNWGELPFGKVSLAFSLTNLFLAFISAAGVVLFPTIKRMDENELPKLYMRMRNTVTPVLFAVMLLYYPLCVVLEKWLPAYKMSLVYLGILLPLITYTSKVSLLTNNYLKAYRKEKEMLIINVAAVAVCMIGALGFAYLLHSIRFILIWVVIVLMLRSVFSEIVIARILNMDFRKDFLIEAVMSAVFLILTSYAGKLMGFLMYAFALGLYSIYIVKKEKS